MGCQNSDASAPVTASLSSSPFWKEMKNCDSKLKQCYDIIALIVKKLKTFNCSETEKKTLKNQLAHTRIMMKKF